jgi:hypothetical protein
MTLFAPLSTGKSKYFREIPDEPEARDKIY